MRGARRFFGWSVAWAAFALAMLTWGIGFYGPSVFLQTLHASRGWSISEISAAITFQFLLSAALVAYLPEIHGKLGIAMTTFGGAVLTAVGLVGWAGAWHPSQLFLAAVPSAVGWAATSGAALNAIVARWFERDRPKAMSLAFNGASVGGILFVPLWVYLIEWVGFPVTALLIAAITVGVVAFLAVRYFSRSPEGLNLAPDGDLFFQPAVDPKPKLSRADLLRSPRFITLSAAFSLGLFAQIGLISHLIVRLTPEVGVSIAGMFVSLATVCAVIGRILLGSWIGDRDRRGAAALNFAVQIAGVLLLVVGGGQVVLALGCILFGLGIGNMTSLPPLIAQKEFNREDVVTVVALIVAINHSIFAFAPATVGAIRDATSDYVIPFAAMAGVQLMAAMIVLLGRMTTSAPGKSV